MKQHFLDYLNERIRDQWGEIALTDYGEKQEYTWGEMACTIKKMHILFQQLGIQKGDKIAIASRNCSNWVVAYLAITTYEGVVVSILQDFKAQDISKLLTHSDSKMLFVGPYVWRELQHETLSGLQAVVSMEDFTILRHAEDVTAITPEQWEELYQQTYPNGIQPQDIHFSADPDALSLLNYTSGSTGSPKGVMLNGRSLSNNVEVGLTLLPVGPRQRLVSMLPLAHMFGQICELLYPLCAGTHIYFLTKSPTPSILLKALQDVQPYMVVTVPLVIEKIHKRNINPLTSKPAMQFCWKTPILGDIIRGKVKKALKKAFGGNIRYFLCGGAAINPTVEQCLKDIHFPISVGYGMTECGPLIGGSHPKNFVAHSGGRPVANMEVKIVNINSEGIGEILVRGENVMMGYYKNEEATRAVMTEDGWMHTGDLGYLDKKNNIFIKGRNKTMILGASGQNIYPEEIEDKLNNQEGVGESIIVEREGKLIGLVFPDEQTTRKFSLEEIERLMKENLKKLNALIPSYSQVSDIEIKKEPFEKTPKRSIKRFLYK